MAISDLKCLESFSNPYVKIIVCCKICNKEQSLKFRFTWKRHYLTHASPEGKPFKCTFCEKTFSRSDGFKLHLKRHQTEIRLHQIKNEYVSEQMVTL